LADRRVTGSYDAVRQWCVKFGPRLQVVRLLAERHIDITARRVLNWVQTFGPQLAAALRKHRRRVGRRWTVDEVGSVAKFMVTSCYLQLVVFLTFRHFNMSYSS
jgi:transposase-like protein